MFIHARIRPRSILFMQRGRYSIPRSLSRTCFLIIPLILLILLPAVSLADDDKIFKKNSKAVVVVIAYDEKGNAISQGSGFIVRADGAVVTNYHVISKASDIKVKKGDKVLDVEGLIFIDKKNDLVILKAKAKDMPVVKLGDIGKANIGKKVYVISSPEGLETAISDGKLFIEEIGQKREILRITTMASLPESSGGPVFNKNSEVIGIAISPFIEGMLFSWIFAMPVDLIKDKISSKKVTAIKEAELEDFEKTAGYWMTHYRHGINHMTSGRHKEAIEAFKQVIRILPNYAEVYLELGKNYWALGMHKEAMEAHKQAIRINPDDALAHFGLGRAYYNLGRHKEAWEAFKQTIRIEPDFVFVFGNGGPTEIEVYKEVIRLYPDFARAHYGLAIKYTLLGMYKEAIEECKQAIRILPDYTEVYLELSGNYAILGMHREGIEALKKAIYLFKIQGRIGPDYAYAHFDLGLAYTDLGMYKEAIEAFKQTIMIIPNHVYAHYSLGIAYLKLNDKGSALEQHKILKSLYPLLANKLFNLIYK